MSASPESLWHVSDDGNIALFRPRIPSKQVPGVNMPVVWAVNTMRLPNYLLLRDCPRITFYRTSNTTIEDAMLFSAPPSGQVVVIENEWLARLLLSNLWLYELPKKHFRCLDENAGYFVSECPVEPISKRRLTGLKIELAARNAAVRTCDELRIFAGQVAASTLGFSIIRLHKASA